MTPFLQFEGLGDYPFYVMAVCATPEESWFTAGQTREKALSAYEVGIKRFQKPLYRIIAHFNPERLKADVALYFHMPSPSQRAH